MAKPFGLFRQPTDDIGLALAFPWPFGYAEHQAFACRDGLQSTLLLRYSDGALALGDKHTFVGQCPTSMPSAIDLKALPLVRTGLRLEEILDEKTWGFAQQCERKTTRMWFYDRAGRGTAAPGLNGAREFRAFYPVLKEKLLAEARALVLGSRPEVKTLLNANLHWPLAAAHYLEHARSGVDLRRRAQALELACALGLNFAMAGDGIRFDLDDPIVRELEHPDTHEAQLAARVQCSIQAVRHVLRRRELFATCRQPDEATQLLLIRGLDAPNAPSHLPRTAADLQAHGKVLRHAAMLPRIGDCPDRWIKFAYQNNATSAKAEGRLKEMLEACSRISADIDRAKDFANGPDREMRKDSTLSVFSKFILQGSPNRIAPVVTDIYHQAFRSMTSALVSQAVRDMGFEQAWACVDHLLAPLSPWSSQATPTGLRFRLLRSRSDLATWGIGAGNCLATAWAVLDYLSRRRLLLAVETATAPHLPVATLATASSKHDLVTMLPPWQIDPIVELKLTTRVDDGAGPSREHMVEHVRMEAHDIARKGHVLWDDVGAMEQWRGHLKPWVKAIEAQRIHFPIGRFVPQAVRDEYLRTTGALPEQLQDRVAHD